MTAPNLLSPTTITGKTVADAVGATDTTILSNASGSNKVLKVNSLIVSNIDGTNACDLTVKHYSAASLGGTGRSVCSTVSVPADASIVVIDRSSAIYLEEDKSLGCLASAAGDLEFVCSYEEIG